MISIQTQDGVLVKNIPHFKKGTWGQHQVFGFNHFDNVKNRIETRKRQGFEFLRNAWAFQFDVESKNDDFTFSNLENCEINKVDAHQWELTSNTNKYLITTNADTALIDPLLTEHEDNFSKVDRVVGALFLLAFLLIPFLSNESVEEEVEEEKKPITVTVIEKPEAVNITRTQPKQLVKKKITKQDRAKIAVKRNLGFLGLAGTTAVKDVVGGLPTNLKDATKGAGKGTDEGSGGELIVGLGKGLKKTTVGNTGVAGLGGVGTVGAGGGKGGYGTVSVASGVGDGISQVGISGKEMLLDGGLSRYVINATIAKYLNQVRRCYEKELQTIPDLEGLVTVAFQINGSGRLNYSRVQKSSLGNKNVEGCITTKMMSWQFPKPKGGVNVSVSYPFMLRPVN